MKKSVMIIGIVLILLIGAGAYALVNRSDDNAGKKATDTSQADNDNDNDSTDTTAANESAGLEQANDSTAAVAATITYTNDGFSPDSVTIKAGDSIKVTNNSDEDLDFASDPHPVHTDDPELNAGSIAPGASKTFKVSNKGTWGYHNHENEEHTGTLIVE